MLIFSYTVIYLCDTLVALGNVTKDGSVLFAKNTDREPDEAHNIVYIPRQKHNKNEKVKTTYLSIPQVEETYEILLLKPFWIWGAEMGANEFGVTIGNEAVWTKEPLRDKGLLGMDLLRLALERSQTAFEALEVITSLIEKYGQGGACGYRDKSLKYHNSYIIADPHEAWVLETADKYWIAEKVRSIRSISNALTIGENYDLIHPDLIRHAIDKGYCKSESDFNFAKCLTPKFHILTIGAKGKTRQSCTTNLLMQNKGKLTPEIMMAILRNHNIPPSKEKDWIPSKSSMKSVCLHASSFLTPSQSTGSHVAHLREDIQVHWVTGTSAPCTSLFKPIFLPNVGIPDTMPEAKEYYDPNTLWWQHEKLHRLVLQDYQTRLSVFRHERDELEKDFFGLVADALAKVSKPPSKKDRNTLKKITEEAFTLNRTKLNEWIKKVQKTPIRKKPSLFYRRYWNKYNKINKLKLD